MFAKTIASIAIVVASATLVTAEANARCGGGHGFRAFSAMQNHNYIIKRQQSLAAAKQRQQAIAAARARQQKAAIAAASRKAEAAKVAKAEIKKDETPAAKVAETTTTETSTTTKVAVAETTCKKFVPAIGVTVDVACGTN
jgi:ATPase subunit of ABC transporter with duplicated ATPase domains